MTSLYATSATGSFLPIFQSKNSGGNPNDEPLSGFRINNVNGTGDIKFRCTIANPNRAADETAQPVQTTDTEVLVPAGESSYPIIAMNRIELVEWKGVAGAVTGCMFEPFFR